jgi:hemerythrin
MPINWNPKLSVGNAFVDTEHKLIISAINGLELALLHPEDREHLKFFIDQLHQIAKEHFHNEEKLQIKFMYPYFEENQSGHKILMAKLDDIKKSIYSFVNDTNTTPEEFNETNAKISETLRGWVIDHIVKTDLKMKGFMDNAI